LAGLLGLISPVTAHAATWYVSPTGSDTAAGTEAAPFASWARAQTAASAGDTVYFRDGTYTYTDATSTCGSTSATISDVVLSKSGTSGNPINYWAYPGEHPLFDFSGVNDTSKYSCRQVGVNMQADWLYLKGLEFKGVLQLNSDNHESWCVYFTGGSNNIVEQCDAHHNEGPGFFIQKGGNNQFINDDSHENEDLLTSNGDGQSADGFGCHPDTAGDTGNIFHGCRAWWNSDDGWDFIKSQEACTVEYSWAWYQGYKPDALSGGKPVALAAGNGNGFKAGGYDLPPSDVPASPPQHIVRFDVAFLNKANGVYANHGPVNAYFYNNTSYSNGTDFDMLGYANGAALAVGILKNNVAYVGNLMADFSVAPGTDTISESYNSWDSNMNLTLSSADFQSVAVSPPASCPATYTPGGTACCSPTDMTCFAGMASARAADGSLPILPFLRLAANSPLIDKGVDVGLPYSGAAPDLGAFETGLAYDGNDGGIASGSSSGATGSSSGAAGSSSGVAGSSSGVAGGSSGVAGSSSGVAGSSSGVAGSSSGLAGSSSGKNGSSGAGTSSGTTGSSGAGTSSGTTGSSGAGTSSGTTGSSGAGGSSSGTGITSSSSGTAGTSSGSSSSAATSSSGTSGAGSSNGGSSSGPVTGGSSGASSNDGGPAGEADNGGSSSGCGCHTVGGSTGAGGAGSASLVALGLLGVVRRRRAVRERTSN
jgi:MYXO-CTERM domain-containing protein